MKRIKLYKHQKDAIKKMGKSDKGIVCMPTGTGKTYCQAAVIAKDIEANPGFGMYVVNVPRIILSYQLLNDVYDFLIKETVESLYMFVHSGGVNDEQDINTIRENGLINGIKTSDINATTNVEGVFYMMARAKKLNLPIIFFSTYNSANRIEEARREFCEEKNISIVLNDEAHYLVQEQFHDILTILKSDRCYFFTATIINNPSNDGRGMNNEDSYGKVLYKMIPREAIDSGYMVRPRLHFVSTNDQNVNGDRYDKNLNRIIKSGFDQHEIELDGNTSPKVLVSVRGTQDIVNFIGIDGDANSEPSNEFIQLRNQGVEIYAVSSNGTVHNNINGEIINSRQEFLRRLRNDGVNKDKKLLVLHYDILSEGISISGFSAIMPLRSLNKSKFLQTFGRCARPDSDDRKLINKLIKEKRSVNQNDLDQLNKPYAYIILPSIHIGNEDEKEYVRNLVAELRELDFDPTDIVISPVIHGTGTEPKNVTLTPRTGDIRDIYKELEDEITARIFSAVRGELSPEELLEADFH